LIVGHSSGFDRGGHSAGCCLPQRLNASSETQILPPIDWTLSVIPGAAFCHHNHSLKMGPQLTSNLSKRAHQSQAISQKSQAICQKNTRNLSEKI
jgi:hypothetical protein